ncbi:DEKNAAC105218 [Brettanomyces naardenensis]|uniref:DEKNAAC105218 n=1 Tax=Brettanomyces naardenensis TaxID=13370 RepID=A0A448YSW3_BRENA|nr:DEKNAAC105218 [Brettanomyces naardenensis]
MLAVTEQYRGLGIAKKLINMTIDMMMEKKCDEIILETEVVNKKALRLYENFGFLRVKRLYRYYLNKHDAYRLILPVTEKACVRTAFSEKLSSEECVEARY